MKQSDIEEGREIFQLLVHSLNGFKGQCWNFVPVS